MLNQVAVLSDIHGVLPALEAVLAEPDVQDADAIAVTGDIISGPQPVEVFDALLALGDRVVWVRGNGERELLEIRQGGTPIPGIPIDPWAAQQLRDDHLELLADMPPTARLTVKGLGEVLFCHATPRDDVEVVVVDSRPERWTEVFASVDPEISTIVCGHTHMPFARIMDGRMVVNPGSIGMPYGRPGAHWAMLGPGITLRHTAFDYKAACEHIAAESGYPDAAQWADEYVHARNTDLEALAAFGPMDGREG